MSNCKSPYKEPKKTCRRGLLTGERRQCNRNDRHLPINLHDDGVSVMAGRLVFEPHVIVDMGEDCGAHVLAFEDYDRSFCNCDWCGGYDD